jgi:hypothetical protein
LGHHLPVIKGIDLNKRPQLKMMLAEVTGITGNKIPADEWQAL